MGESQLTATGNVHEIGADTWRLEVGAGPAGEYRLAQLDDHTSLKRRDFPHKPPTWFKVEARASAEVLPGTWGFGLWNDPFSTGMGMGGGTRRLPTKPEAAWFFFASGENYLTLRNDLPGHGATAGTYQSRRIAWPLLLPGAALLPLMLWRGGSRLVRGMANGIIRQDAVRLDVQAKEWNEYAMVRRQDKVTFRVNGGIVLETEVSPRGRLGVVMWLDNQYAAWRPDGSWGFGTLAHDQSSWIELRGFEMEG